MKPRTHNNQQSSKRGNSIIFTAFLLLLQTSTLSQPLSFPLGSQISVHDNTTWTSQNGIFALGFLNDYQKDRDGFVVAIWHAFVPATEQRVPVWTAGGGVVRVSENSTFELSQDGSFLLSDASRHGLPVWSSNTDNLGVRSAALMDNGNLILVGFGGKIIWESFTSPTDTLLPGQPFYYPQSLQAASPNSVASYYSLKVKSFGEISLVWEDNVTYWSSHVNSSALVKEARLDPDGQFGMFDYAGNVLWSRLSEDFRDPFVIFRRLRIDADGNLRIYSWDNVTSDWKVSWQAVQNQCDVFGSCGLYSVCSYGQGQGGPSCRCLNSASGEGECQRMSDLGNCDKGYSMTVLQRTVLYGLYPPHDVQVMLGSDACERYCLNDTSCFAATSKNDGSGVCTIKRTSFVTGYSYSSVHATSFLKVCLVPLAVSAQAANLHGNGGAPLAQTPQTEAELVGRRKNYMVAVVVLLLITGFVFLAVEMAVFWFFLYKRRKAKAVQVKRSPFGKDVGGLNPHYSALVRLSLEEVKALTKNFGKRLGLNVYKGSLPNNIMVIVKVLNDVVTSEREFQLLVSTLGSTHHRNLVALKGFCYEPKHKLLVYEYMSNGSLAEWLVSKRQNKRDGWQERLSIAIGIARALAYLHLQCKQCIVHGNLKLENVLLDENLVPKLTDFGVHSLLKKDSSSSSVETLPERDVYMFGMILLQIVAGKREGSENGLRDSAYQLCEDGRLGEFVDEQLEGTAEIEGVQRVVRLALWCVQDNSTLRPSIGEVVMVLEGALSLDMPPRTGGAPRMETHRSSDANMDIVEASL